MQRSYSHSIVGARVLLWQFLFLLVLATAPAKAGATSFDDCVLKSLGAAQVKEAVYAIEAACRSKLSITFPADQSDKIVWSWVTGTCNDGTRSGSLQSALILNVSNNSALDVTALLLSIINKLTKAREDRQIERFTRPHPTDVIVTGLGFPRYDMIKSGVSAQLCIDASTLGSPELVRKQYDISVAPRLGIPNGKITNRFISDCKTQGECWGETDESLKRIFLNFLRAGYEAKYFLDENHLIEKHRSKDIPYTNISIDDAKQYFDDLYAAKENWSVSFSMAYDLALRKKLGVSDHELTSLIALYRQAKRPLSYGYLVDFVPPNKVVISNDVQGLLPVELQKTQMITLLGVSSTPKPGHDDRLRKFMSALISVRACRGLVQVDQVNSFIDDEAGQRFAEAVRRSHPFPQSIKVLIVYPNIRRDDEAEEFFNPAGDLSGKVMLDLDEHICSKLPEGVPTPLPLALSGSIKWIRLGDILTAGGAKEYIPFDPQYLDLTKYLYRNGFVNGDTEKNDGRRAFGWASKYVYEGFSEEEGKHDSVEKVLATGRQ